MSVLLIPSIHLVSQSKQNHRRLQLREAMLFEADQLIEQSKIALADPTYFGKAMASPSGLIESHKIDIGDGPVCLGQITLLRDRSLPLSALLSVEVVVWHDRNGNERVDAGEPNEHVRTQVAM